MPQDFVPSPVSGQNSESPFGEDKSSLCSVKQFAEMTGTTESTLRYYDTIGLFKPAERGRNNYRYYVPYQMIALKFINVLANVGVKLTYIRNLEHNRSPGSVAELLEEQEKEFTRQIARLDEARLIIRTFKENIQSGLAADRDFVGIKQRGAMPIKLGEPNVWSKNELFYGAFGDFLKLMSKKGANTIYPTGGFFENWDAFYASPSQPNRFYLADPKGEHTIPAGEYITAYAKGYYGDMDGAEQRIAEYIKQRGIKPKGGMYVLYMIDEVSSADPASYIAEIALGIDKA